MKMNGNTKIACNTNGERPDEGRKQMQGKYTPFRNLLSLCLIMSVASCANQKAQSVNRLTRQRIGQVDGKRIYIYTLINDTGIKAKIMNYGAILFSLEVPDGESRLEDVTLGYATLEEYVGSSKYFGATIGRYGNRIDKGKFMLEGREYTLSVNNGENHLHGGLRGFNKVVWDSKAIRSDQGIGVQLTYLSPDGEEGYPGNLRTTVAYILTRDNQLKIEYAAQTDKSTPVNLTHHSFWNLSGGVKRNILGHELMLNADSYLPVNEGLIPTGEIRSVKSTPMDFTSPVPIGSRIDQVPGGYDHTYVLNRRDDGRELILAADVYDSQSGRGMRVYTTEPGIQFYSGNFLDGTIIGKDNRVYNKYDAFCLETQHFPNSPNQPEFPSVILQPGQMYSHRCIYQFYIKY